MRRIIIISGPAKLRIPAIIGVISVFGLRQIDLRLLNQFFGFIFPERGFLSRAPGRRCLAIGVFFPKTGNKDWVAAVVLNECNRA